jgi:hypothetical protein
MLVASGYLDRRESNVPTSKESTTAECISLSKQADFRGRLGAIYKKSARWWQRRLNLMQK